MSSCPNCGNYWNDDDDENHAAAEAAQRLPILTVKLLETELDISYQQRRCTACSAEWIGSYKMKKLVQVERWIKTIPPKPNK